MIDGSRCMKPGRTSIGRLLVRGAAQQRLTGIVAVGGITTDELADVQLRVRLRNRNEGHAGRHSEGGELANDRIHVRILFTGCRELLEP